MVTRMVRLLAADTLFIRFAPYYATRSQTSSLASGGVSVRLLLRRALPQTCSQGGFMPKRKAASVSQGILYARKTGDGAWCAWTIWKHMAVSALEDVTLRQVEAYARRERYSVMLV